MRNKDYCNFPIGYFLSRGLACWHCWWLTLTRRQFSDVNKHLNCPEGLLKHSSLGSTPGFLISWVPQEAWEGAFLTSSCVKLIAQAGKHSLRTTGIENNWDEVRGGNAFQGCRDAVGIRRSTTDHFTSHSQTTPLKVVMWNCLCLCYQPPSICVYYTQIV